MELRGVTLRMPEVLSSPTRLLFAVGLGAWMTGLVWVLSRSPWAGVFALGVALGWAQTDKWLLLEEERERRDEVAELEKQVVSLRATLSRLTLERLTEYDARAAFRRKRHVSSEPIISRSLS